MWLAYTLNPLTLTKVMPLIYQGEKDRMSLVIIWCNKSETVKRNEYKKSKQIFSATEDVGSNCCGLRLI